MTKAAIQNLNPPPHTNLHHRPHQGLTLEEAATLLNVDANDPQVVQPLYDAALNVKEQIYGAWGCVGVDWLVEVGEAGFGGVAQVDMIIRLCVGAYI